MNGTDAREAQELSSSGYRLYTPLAVLFVVSLLIANTIAVKVIQVGPFVLPAGILVFPIAYINGDVLVEIYGYRRTRSIIYLGFAGLLLMSAMYYLAVMLTPAVFWKDQEAFARLFGFVPRLAAASFIAYLIGELLNAVVMSWMKVRTNGRNFGFRAVLSTIVGQGADSFVFNFAAFLGVFAFTDVVKIAVSGWVLKTAYEVVVLPVTYWVVRKAKQIEGVDTYDHGVSYNPLPS